MGHTAVQRQRSENLPALANASTARAPTSQGQPTAIGGSVNGQDQGRTVNHLVKIRNRSL